MTERPDLQALIELGERLEAARRGRRDGALRPLMRPALVLTGVLAILVAVAFTPPGRAVTGEIADRIGIVGGPPTQPSRVGHFDPATDQVVLAVGEAADGHAFEIVAFRSDRNIGDRNDGAICVNVEWPAGRSDSSGSCYAGALRYGAMCCTSVVLGTERPGVPTSVPWAEGEISPRVDSVEVSYVDTEGEEHTVDAVVGMITPEIATKFEIDHPSGMFFASLPNLAGQTGVPAHSNGAKYRAPAHPVVMSSFDAEGKLLESETSQPVSERRIERIERQNARREALDAFQEECVEPLRRSEDPPIAITPEVLSPHCQELLEATR